MADASEKRDERQRALLAGIILPEEEDDTLPDGTAAPSLEDKPKRKKRAATLLAE